MFKQRLTPPEKTNKYFLKEPVGYSPCILGNEAHRAYPMSVLPNCVGYATGRFNEIAGFLRCKYLGNTDAKNFVSLASSQGLKVGETPALGSCIVWGSKEHGHVAIVESVYSDTEILISQSGWSSSFPMWSGVHRKGSDGNWTEGYDERWMKGKYNFLGFIYQPKEVVELTQEEFNKMMNVYLKSLETKPASPYAAEALKWAKDSHIMEGNGTTQMPKSFLTREDFAVMLKRSQNG